MKRRLENPTNTFPVICLCGSAGGLEAYKTILRKLPADSGMAFVILAHRAPGNTTLPLLLAGATRMPVYEIEEGMLLEPDCIFLLPPRVNMTTSGQRFHLEPRLEPRGWPISISTFLFSLAASAGPRVVAVILSGMAYDGSAALGAVKAGGGTTFAQSGADCESMPQHAIDTGHVDFILTAAEIGVHLSTMAPRLRQSSRSYRETGKSGRRHPIHRSPARYSASPPGLSSPQESERPGPGSRTGPRTGEMRAPEG